MVHLNCATEIMGSCIISRNTTLDQNYPKGNFRLSEGKIFGAIIDSCGHFILSYLDDRVRSSSQQKNNFLDFTLTGPLSEATRPLYSEISLKSANNNFIL